MKNTYVQGQRTALSVRYDQHTAHNIKKKKKMIPPPFIHGAFTTLTAETLTACSYMNFWLCEYC